MSSQTPNLNLVLPVGTENVSRQIINDNNTKIDTAVGLNSQAIAKLDSNTNSTNDILADALTSNTTKFFSGSGSSYTGTVPNGNYKYGTFMVNRRYGTKTVLAQSANNDIAINTYDGSSWTGWQELALNSKITPETVTVINGACYLSVIGNICILNIGGSIQAPTGSQTTIATLDTNYRPTRTTYGVVAIEGGSSNKYALVAITAGGVITIYNYSGTSANYLYGSIMFVR